MFNYIARIYEKGIGVDINYENSLKYYRQSIEGDLLPESIFNLAEMYRLGIERYLDNDVNLYYYLINKTDYEDQISLSEEIKKAY